MFDVVSGDKEQEKARSSTEAGKRAPAQETRGRQGNQEHQPSG